MKGVTKIDNLSWVNNLGSDMIIERSMPIHEYSSHSMSSLDARKELMLAISLAQAQNTSINKKNSK